MDGYTTEVWGLVAELRERGALWTLASPDGTERTVFADGEAAERFGRIVSRAEHRELAPVRLTGDHLRDWLDVLSLQDEPVLIGPEYVAGQGVVAIAVPAGQLREALASVPVNA